MDRLEYLQRFDLPADLLDGVPAHRVTRLRRQGERYYADGMRDLPEDRRLAILAVCTLEWRSEEHTSELQSLMRISSAVFCLKKKKTKIKSPQTIGKLQIN